MEDTERGLYSKYRAIKTSGEHYRHIDEDGSVIKIQGWPMEEVTEPFMLMKFDDRHGRIALAAYADSVDAEYPKLASDIRIALDQANPRWRDEVIDNIRQQLKRMNEESDGT